jgi:hypothetical protein
MYQGRWAGRSFWLDTQQFIRSRVSRETLSAG